MPKRDKAIKGARSATLITTDETRATLSKTEGASNYGRTNHNYNHYYRANHSTADNVSYS